MSEQAKRKYDATVARIAGNILSGADLDFAVVALNNGREHCGYTARYEVVERAVALARAIVAEVEWRAEQEVASCAQEFVEWLMEREDISDLSRMIAFYKSGRTTDCRTIVDNIVSDYQQYRVATLTSDEENDIAEAL